MENKAVNLKNKDILQDAGNIVVSEKGNPEGRDLIYVGNVMFTSNGRKLYDLVDVEYKQYRNNIFSYIENELFNHNCTIESTNIV